MSSQNTRIWESPPSNPISSPINSLNHDHVKPAQLPSIATLTSELPRNNQPSSPNYPSNNRTSDPWGGSQTQSTRSSGFSGFGYASSSISSPQRASNTSQFGTTSYPADMSSPTSAGAQASSAFTSPQPESRISQLSQPDHHRNSHHSDSFPPQESRRSSIGSAVNSGFGNLQLNGGGSPYGAHGNPSHSSIAASLQRERGSLQTNGVRNSTASSIHQHPFSPLGPQQGETRQQYNSRTAPSITHNPIREVYNADQPTAGQPYAFPDPDLPPNESKPHLEPNGRAVLSRRNSDHASIASSIITTDSKYPPGQARLDEDPMPGTHHHSLQGKRISGTSGDGDSPEASTPYSRTPALRQSHKMAERKRRTEMKHLFDQLRNQIPPQQGAKSSKWEILSKASDYIKQLEGEKYSQEQQAYRQFQEMQATMEAMRRENEALKQGQGGPLPHATSHPHPQQSPYASQQQPDAFHRGADRPGTANTIGPQPSSYAAGPGAPQPMQVDPSRSLPPLANGVHAPGSSMQGVQYSDERR